MKSETVSNFNFDNLFKSGNRYTMLSSKYTPEPVYQRFRDFTNYAERSGLQLITSNRYPAEEYASEHIKNKIVVAKNTVKEIRAPDMLDIQPETYDNALDCMENYIPWIKKLIPSYKMYYVVTIVTLLGTDVMSPVNFALTFSKNGAMRGKTMFIERLCDDFGIPIINLGDRPTSKFLSDMNIFT